jgi:hypothetical protein
MSSSPEPKSKVLLDFVALALHWGPVFWIAFRTDPHSIYKLFGLIIDGRTLQGVMTFPVGVCFFLFIGLGGLSPSSAEMWPSTFLFKFVVFSVSYPVTIYALSNHL